MTPSSLPCLLLLCLPQLAYALTDQQKSVIVEKHNVYRSKTEPPASDMRSLIWDSSLESLATSYAAKCIWEHNEERGFRGENLFLMSGSGLDVEMGLEDWHNERDYYNFTTNHCQEGQMCGHYTQVVWASTERVGCGWKFCEKVEGFEDGNMYLLVCNYEPPGNMQGEKPYIIGPPCSDCPASHPCQGTLCVDPEQKGSSTDTPEATSELASDTTELAPTSQLALGTTELASDKLLETTSTLQSDRTTGLEATALPEILTSVARSVPTTASPTLPDISDSPPLPDIAASPPLPDISASPPLPDVAASPPLPDIAASPPLPDIAASPPLPDVATSPPLPDISASPPLPDIAASPPLPDIAASPPLPDVAASPPLPDVAASPPLPDIADKLDAKLETTASAESTSINTPEIPPKPIGDNPANDGPDVGEEGPPLAPFSSPAESSKKQLDEEASVLVDKDQPKDSPGQAATNTPTLKSLLFPPTPPPKANTGQKDVKTQPQYNDPKMAQKAQNGDSEKRKDQNKFNVISKINPLKSNYLSKGSRWAIKYGASEQGYFGKPLHSSSPIGQPGGAFCPYPCLNSALTFPLYRTNHISPWGGQTQQVWPAKWPRAKKPCKLSGFKRTAYSLYLPTRDMEENLTVPKS